ncbi:DUF6295 family protein [Streptomyces aurantiacus]|uniref:Uncharacterized protein n=1 Tax=Streptomyces aurantiacus TaxID=47760 RepID=A0A7G1P052_9ACTN|nr:DUF6295 family protein [Streptomyces aurantiacus]BCL28619.1 hypothetical protein GCM10017557_34780 [Streptomyces aurantiacus]
MCTWMTEQIGIAGAARGVPDWLKVTRANVFYDHPVSAPYDHALIIDFVDPDAGVGARVGIELSAASAWELVRAITAALESPEARADLAAERHVLTGSEHETAS